MKLECLQPADRSRCAGPATLMGAREAVARGVYTASAGNMAGRVLGAAPGVPCTALVPENAPETKL
jgi:threonine dehydratase